MIDSVPQLGPRSATADTDFQLSQRAFLPKPLPKLIPMTALVTIAELMLGLYRLQMLMINNTARVQGEEERGGLRNQRHKINAGFWTGLISAMPSVARQIVAHVSSGIGARK
jgi:hypothetical protein